jgi:histidinol dehydrogenase
VKIIKVLDLRGVAATGQELGRLLPRASVDIEAAAMAVGPILQRVREGGSSAIRAISQELDGFSPEPIRVPNSEIERALAQLDNNLRLSIELAIERVRTVSTATMPKQQIVQLASGATVTQRYRPMDSVGLYAPGGKAVYPSSVIMNVVPAQVAGVAKLQLASPGQKDFEGRPHPSVLATAALLGVEDIFCMGGPAAIAAFGFGVADLDLEPVQLIAGPGNIYVAAAKRLLRGQLAIDSEAGTTEIMIVADGDANARFIAADLISQAEHDEAAAAVLLTDSQQLIDAVLTELADQLASTVNQDRAVAALRGQQSALVLVSSIDQAIEIANHYATEHLEIQTRDAVSVADRISNAGAVFIGEYSPVSLGDYLAGSNHVLPTGGSARFSSGLGVHTFLSPQQLIEYQKTALEAVSEPLVQLAQAEGLPAHGRAVLERFRVK